MDNTLRKAAEMALEALNEVTGWQWAGPMRVMDEVEDAIEALRQALAQPEQSKYSDIVSDGGLDPRNKFDAQQEPVAWMASNNKDIVYASEFDGNKKNRFNIPLFTAPTKRAWVGLTDKEAGNLFKDTDWENEEWGFLAFARAIEAKLKELNT